MIFTDSLSSLHLLANRRPRHYSPDVFNIQSLLLSLNSSRSVKLQFVPSHKGIVGNEAADAAAREAHSLPYLTLPPLSREEIKSSLHTKLLATWHIYWSRVVAHTSTGRFLRSIKSELGDWPWACHKSRSLERAMARLRLGHAGVRAHLSRFGMGDTDLCVCGAVETIEHFLLFCPLHRVSRVALSSGLSLLGVPMTLPNVLGGGPFPAPVQMQIVNLLSQYLTGTGKLHVL